MNALIPVGATGVPRLALSYDETAATFNATTSELILSDAAMSRGFEIMLTALDAAGEATGVYRLSAVSLGLAPRAVGTLANIDLDQASGTRTVDASTGFTGEVRTYELVNGPAGVSIDSVTGLVTISTVDPMTAVIVTVRANNAAGSATQTFQVTVRFHLDPPLAIGTLPAVELKVGAAAFTVNSAAAFSGVVTQFALETPPANVTIDASTGVVTITPSAAIPMSQVSVRASNPAGSVTQTFSLAVTAPLPAPTAVGSLAAVQLDVGAAAVTVNAAAAFAGVVNQYALENAPASVTINATTGVVTVTPSSVLAATAITIRASNASGSATQAFQLTVRPLLVAPVAVGTLAAVQLDVGAAAVTVNAAAAFSGVVSQYALENAPASVTINATTGVVTVTPASVLAATPITIRASNASGSATQAFQLTVRPLLVAPVAVGTLSALQLDLGAASRTVNAAAAFSGTVSQYALVNPPATVTIDGTTGVVTIAPTAVLPTTPITIRASNASGSATQSFALTIYNFVATTFDTPASLSALSFVTPVQPTWTSVPEGYGRIVLASKSRAHGNWTGAQGDGLYRSLVRWSGATLSASVDRRFTFGARIRLEGTFWFGVRVEAFSTTAGDRRLHIREYSGDATSFVSLATVSVPWDYDTWYWFEVEIIGSSVRGRLYPELGTAPDWQITATTTQIAPGAFGPGGFPALQQSPVIDVRRLEYLAPRV